MEEIEVKISLTKVLELALAEERNKIRKFYLDTLGKPTADIMDTYVPTESEILKLIKQ